MVKFADIMGFPVACTEQFARGLGPTVHELSHIGKDRILADKTQFSMLVPEVEKFLEEHKPRSAQKCIGLVIHIKFES